MGRFSFTIAPSTTTHATSAIQARYSHFETIGVYIHRQGETGLVGALKGHRDREKKFEKVLKKRVDKWMDVWYIIDKLKSDI